MPIKYRSAQVDDLDPADVDGNFHFVETELAARVKTVNGVAPDGTGNLTVTGNDSYVEFAQASPLSVWNITHNLGKRPSVTVVDASGDVVAGDVRHLSSLALRITFSSAFSGTAYLN